MTQKKKGYTLPPTITVGGMKFKIEFREEYNMTNVTFKNVKTNIEINETELHILFRAMKDYKNKVKVVADEFPVHYVNVDTMLDKLNDAKSRIITNVANDIVE